MWTDTSGGGACGGSGENTDDPVEERQNVRIASQGLLHGDKVYCRRRRRRQTVVRPHLILGIINIDIEDLAGIYFLLLFFLLRLLQGVNL